MGSNNATSAAALTGLNSAAGAPGLNWSETVDYAKAQGYDIIVLAGQSNAVGFGCGPKTDVSKAYDSRIFQITPDLKIILAQDPLSHRPTLANATGFGMTFARLYAATLPANRKVLIVPAARGSTSILQWDDFDEQIDFKEMSSLPKDSTELWQALYDRTAAALKAGNSANRVVAFLWHQGENDYSFFKMRDRPFHAWMPDVDAYMNRLSSLTRGMRISLAGGRTIPFLAGELGGFWQTINGPDPGGSFLNQFNQNLRQLSTLPATQVVSAAGLQSNLQSGCSTDDAHFSASAQVEFGRRYFEAFKTLNAAPVKFDAAANLDVVPPYRPTLDIANVSRVLIRLPTTPAHRFLGVEATPWITKGGAFSYTITTAETANCWSFDSIAKVPSIVMNCVDINTSTLSSEAARGTPLTDRRPWARNYDGIFSQHRVQDAQLGDILLSIHHGENLNEVRNWGDVSVTLQNSVSPGLTVDNCRSDYTGGPNSAAPLNCYFAFLSAGWIPSTLATSWGSAGTYNSTGPIAWPVSGYIKADGTQASRGLRHPSSILANGYIYVFYLDASLGAARGIRVIRARVELARDVNSWERLENGKFVKGTMPAGFSMQGDRINPAFYKIPGPKSDFVFPNTERVDMFSVAKLRHVPGYIGVQVYGDAQGNTAFGLRFSLDLIRWSDLQKYSIPGYTGMPFPQGGPYYPVLMNWEGTSNSLVDIDRFYVVGAMQGNSNLLRIPFTMGNLRSNYQAPPIRFGAIDAGTPISCNDFNPDAIKQFSSQTIEWLATLQPHGLTLHENYLAARETGYSGAFGQGEHNAYLNSNPSHKAAFEAYISSMANTPNPPYGTFREHHIGQRAAGYRGLWLCGGGACFFSGGCDDLGRRK